MKLKLIKDQSSVYGERLIFVNLLLLVVLFLGVGGSGREDKIGRGLWLR